MSIAACRKRGLADGPARFSKPGICRERPMFKLNRTIVTAALLFAPLALAVTPAQSPAGKGGSHVDSATLHKFAKAFEQVQVVDAKYKKKLKTARGPTRYKALKRKEGTEMRKRISRFMPVIDYMRLGKEINKSRALRRRLIVIVREDRKKAAKARHHGGN